MDPMAAVPDSVAVPLPLSAKLTPSGSVPDSVTTGMTAPDVVTVKLNGTPTVAVALAALVNVGTWFVVSVKSWEALVTSLLAVMVIGQLALASGAVGVPASVAVPLPLSVKVTPVGRVPDSRRDGLGKPLVLTTKANDFPGAACLSDWEVMIGA